MLSILEVNKEAKEIRRIVNTILDEEWYFDNEDLSKIQTVVDMAYQKGYSAALIDEYNRHLKEEGYYV